MGGYIKLWRGWRDCDIFRDEQCSEREGWLWLIENAAWKDTTRHTGKGLVVAIKRGQIHTSLRALGGVWGWPKSTVERYITRLETGTMLKRKAGHNGMILTICNYDKYQGEDERPRDSGGTQVGTVAGQWRDTQEEEKNLKKEKKEEVDPPDGGNSYVFSGAVIHLGADDFDKWEVVYHAIPDLRAELMSLDTWFQGDGAPKAAKWFFTTSGALNRKHQEIMAQRAKEEADYFKIPL